MDTNKNFELKHDIDKVIDLSMLPVASREFPSGIKNTLIVFMVIIVLACSYIVFGSLAENALVFERSIIVMAMIGMSIAIGVIIFIVTMEIIVENKKIRESEKKIPQFATVNHFEYAAKTDSSSYTTRFFSVGVGAEVQHVVKGRRFEVGEYIIEDGSSPAKFHHYGFIEITLESKVPHIILDSVSNETSQSSEQDYSGKIRIDLNKDQMMQLEGDFTNYFRVYVAEGYARDALYILTPDLMAILADTVADYDIEFVDNKLYLASRDVFRTADQFYKAFSAIEKITNAVNKRSDRYVDEHTSSVEVGRKYLAHSNNFRYVFYILGWAAFVFFIMSGVMKTN